MGIECSSDRRIVGLEIEVKSFRGNHLLVDDKTRKKICSDGRAVIEACVMTLGDYDKGDKWLRLTLFSCPNSGGTCASDLGELLLPYFSILTLADAVPIEEYVFRQAPFLSCKFC